MRLYAAFLRGINVGARRATSDQLRSSFEGLGFEEVATFRASGNIIFSAGGKVDGAKIERALKKALGYEVATFVRTAAEVKAIAKHDPFDARRLKNAKGKPQVALLAAKPTAQARKKMLALQSDDDLLAVRGRELYWLPSGGLMESAIGMNGITAVLGSNTVRTQGTIEQIASKYFDA
jgi:uncharacterized protein (DUF1697 family)